MKADKHKSNRYITISRTMLGLVLMLIGSNFLVEPSLADERSKGLALDFMRPEILSRGKLFYPTSMRGKSHSGMVELSFMVDKTGQVYAPLVTRSSDARFEKSAIAGVLKYKFKPAMLNGMPIDSHFEARIFFLMNAPKGSVSAAFFSSYDAVRKELDKAEPSQKKVRGRIRRMKNAFNLNEYSIAHLALAEYNYASKFSDSNTQLEALKKLRMYDGRATDSKSLLGEEIVGSVKAKIIQLELQLGHLMEAIQGHRRLAYTSPALAAKFDDAIGKAERILIAGDAFARQVNLDNRGSQQVTLNATKFSIEDVDGKISGLVFRCERGYSEIPFQASSKYAVPEKWGECWLQIKGDADSVVKLVQFK